MLINGFSSFDPLDAKQIQSTEVAALAQKRELKNILGSYVGWFDPFCELIQNSLDSIEKKLETAPVEYRPSLYITLNLQDNSLIVTDNGLGLDEPRFTQFLCPNISFKTPGKKNRGHKGVGATYIAYGFNDVQVSTKTNSFKAIGRMQGARRWLDDESPAGNPQMYSDHEAGYLDPDFEEFDTGVSIYLKFDKQTHPSDLNYYQTKKPEQWLKILKVKTGIGAFFENKKINIRISIIDKTGNRSFQDFQGVEYLWPENEVVKKVRLRDILTKQDELYDKGKDIKKDLPSKLKNAEILYDFWDTNELLSLSDNKRLGISFSEDEIYLIKKYEVNVHASYVYTVKIWDNICKKVDYRKNSKLLYGGVQISANNMPQGNLIQIPLNRNIGRQNQLHCVVHFNNCSADLGRKGFNNEISELAKELSKKIADGPFLRFKFALQVNTGNSISDLESQQKIADWKAEMARHEESMPLILENENFFLPQRKISITSVPTREQDVIALFNQMIAGGVIRGLRIMSTNERTSYDGLYRIIIEEPIDHHLYDENKNPLGISEYAIPNELPLLMEPRILEYKFNMDALFEDISNGNKNSNDLDLLIVWESGSNYEEHYKITSLLDPDNLNLRQYHGVTHIATNTNTDQREFDIIILSELIKFLNNPRLELENQLNKYESNF
ncbi:hypothetical protein ACLDXR_11910 [Acinetobacter baumannii]|uniref:hypothetical protein n=2 Tax=Acinetobacter baumannii TaxID=470 RepID=UPI0012317DAB|nr:hypothetical protein [Acinetobacter baumannii]